MGNEQVIVKTSSSGKEKESILDILQRVEYYSLAEKWAGDIPEEAITRVSQVHFGEIAIKHATATGLPLLVTTPLAFAVINKLFPIFGKTQPGLIDKIFAFSLSALPSLGIAIFIGTIMSLIYHGHIVKKIKSTVYLGLIVGKIATGIVCFSVFHIIYYLVLRNPKFYIGLYKLVGEKLYIKIAPIFYYYIGDVLIPSSWYVLIITISAIGLLFLGERYGAKKTKEYKRFIEKWKLR